MDSIENLLVDIKESLEREIGALRQDLEREVGALRQETREGFALVGKRLDRVEATMLHVDGRLTAMSRADIQTDQQITELLTRQHAQQQSIDDLYARIRKLEQPSQS
jgi:argonaute-like protein implicated in RNA metabolism and viral defense